MRIAMFSWESLHSIAVGGIATHATELAAGLERQGHEVHVFTRMGHEQAEYEDVHGVHYHRCRFDLNPNFVDEVNNMCRAFVARFFAVEDGAGAFDVVHAHDWLASNAAVWIKEGRGRKAVVTVHSTEYGRNGNQFFGGQSPRIHDHERHATFCADRVITVSHRLKDEINWLYQVPHAKTATIYNGVNSRTFDYAVDAGAVKGRYGIGPLDPTILFVGRMVVQKGPDILVRTMPSILRYYPHAKFVFVGDGHMKNDVQRMGQQFGVAHALRVLGAKSGASCTTCSRPAILWRSPVATSLSASSSWKVGARISPSSAPSGAGRQSSSGTTSTACRSTTRPTPWLGVWEVCWPITAGPAGWDATAARPWTPSSVGTTSPNRLKTSMPRSCDGAKTLDRNDGEPCSLRRARRRNFQLNPNGGRVSAAQSRV